MGKFRFSDFSVDDSRCGQKICSDAVLFAAWAWQGRPVRGTVLDIGTGSGLLALITARLCPDARVTAVELDSEACKDARENFAAFPHSHRPRLKECSFEAFVPDEPPEAIICNPPFFSTGALACEESRAAARHEASLSLESAARYAARHLAPDGRLLLIGPAEREEHTVFAAELAGLKLRRRALVRTTPRKAPTRAFWEFSPQDGPLESEEIDIRDADNRYSPEYLRLTEHLYHHL